MKKYLTIISNNEKPGGYHVVHTDHKELNRRIDEGYKFIAYLDDMVFFAENIAKETNFISELRK